MRFLHPKVIGILALLLALWILMALQTDSFLSGNNMENLFRRTAMYSVLGIGAAFVIITSGIDLSVGSVVCLAGCLLSYFLEVRYEPFVQNNVAQVIADESKFVLASRSDSFQIGDTISFDQAKLAPRGTYTVKAIESAKTPDGADATALIVNQRLRKDDTTGVVSRSSAIAEVKALSVEGQAEILIATDNNQVKPRDHLLLLNGTTGKKELIIESASVNDGQLKVTVSGAENVDNKWVAILLDRQPRMGILPAISITLIACSLLGLIHGLLITRLSIQPFVVTLCALLIYRGLARWVFNDNPVGLGQEYDEFLRPIATGKLPINETVGIPYPVLITLGIALIAGIFLKGTVWGRYIYALGRNETAARYSGIRTVTLITFSYVVCAFLAGVGGILFLLESNSASPSNFGREFELFAIAAAVLGGCSLKGGEGGVVGVLLGALLIQTLRSVTVLLKINDQLELTILGSVILLGVIFDESFRRIAAARRRMKQAAA
jgi:ribose transport system permease protein